MAKIGTAHVEIKPVLDEEALAAIAQKIEDAVAAGVQRGLTAANKRSGIFILDWDGHPVGQISEIIDARRQQARESERSRRA